MNKQSYTNKWSFILIPLVLWLFGLYCAFGQTYPLEQPNTATYGSYIAPSNDIPDYLQWFDSELSDSRIMRISDRVEFGVTGQRVRHNYSLDQVWNSDETLIKLAGYPAAIIDAETYEFLYWSNIPSYGRWSNTQNNIIYGTSGNSFVSHDVNTNQRTILRTFTDYNSVDFGFGKSNQDNNDKYVGLIGINGNTLTLIVYDIQNDAVTATRDIVTSNLGWFTVSQSGNYAVVMLRNAASGLEKGITSFDINLENEHHLTPNNPHSDLAYDQQGNEVLVAYGDREQWDSQHSLFMARLDGGGITNLFPYVNGLGIWGGHISARNTDRQGWAYVSEACCSSNPVAPSELFAIKLDDSGIVERYAKHHGQPTTYLHQVQAVPNRNGTKILFASNWKDDSEIAEEAAQSFVLEVNQETLNTPTIKESLTVEEPYKVMYYDITGRELKTLDHAAAGIYFIKSFYQNRIENQKYIKQ